MSMATCVIARAWLRVCINVYAETDLTLAGAKKSTSTPQMRVTSTRAGVELVEFTVPLRCK